MKIDIHVHCDSCQEEDVKKILAECEKHEIALCIMGASPRGDHEPQFLKNKDVLQVANEHPDVFIPFAWIDLWEKVDPDSITRLVDEGFRGVKFIAPFHPYDHDSYMPLYELIEKYKLPALFHTGLYRPSIHDKIHKRPLLTNMSPFTLDRITRSFPDMKIVMAHMGTSIWRQEAAALIKTHPNIYADLAGSGNFLIKAQKLTEFLNGDYDLTEKPEYPVALEKLVFGSDSYFSLERSKIVGWALESYEKLLQELNAPYDVVENVMGGTVKNWFSDF